MISPELAGQMARAEQGQVPVEYKKIEMDSKALAAAVEGAGVVLDAKAKEVITKGKILAAYKSETADKASILVAVGDKVVVVVVENLAISNSQLYSGAELLQYDKQGVWATNTGGYVKHNPAESTRRVNKIAEFDALINDQTTTNEAKSELKKKRDAYISGQTSEASVEPNPEEIFAQIEEGFFKVKGGELDPAVLRGIQNRRSQSNKK